MKLRLICTFQIIACILIVAASAIGANADGASSRHVYITDFGINQASKKVIDDETVTTASNQVFSDDEIPSEGRFLIVMPDTWANMTPSEKQAWKEGVIGRLRTSFQSKLPNYEIQLVQAIGGLEYMIADKRSASLDWGKYAYGAINEARSELGPQKTTAVVGSHGGKVFAVNVMHCPVEHAVITHSRALPEETAAILDPKLVGRADIITTSGDFFGGGTMANPKMAERLLDAGHTVRVFKLEPLWPQEPVGDFLFGGWPPTDLGSLAQPPLTYLSPLLKKAARGVGTLYRRADDVHVDHMTQSPKISRVKVSHAVTVLPESWGAIFPRLAGKWRYNLDGVVSTRHWFLDLVGFNSSEGRAAKVGTLLQDKQHPPRASSKRFTKRDQPVGGKRPEPSRTQSGTHICQVLEEYLDKMTEIYKNNEDRDGLSQVKEELEDLKDKYKPRLAGLNRGLRNSDITSYEAHLWHCYWTSAQAPIYCDPIKRLRERALERCRKLHGKPAATGRQAVQYESRRRDRKPKAAEKPSQKTVGWNKDKALFDAVEAGDIDLVRVLLAKGANPNAKDKEGATPLMKTVPYYLRKNWRPMTDLLIAGGAKVDTTDAGGRAIIHRILNRHFHSIGEHFEILEYFLDRGVDIEAKDGDGQTPLIVVFSKRHCSSCSSVVKFLLQRGAHVNAVDNKGRTALMWAAKKCDRNDEAPCFFELLAAGAEIHSKDHRGRTALNYAVKAGNTKFVAELLRRGAK